MEMGGNFCQILELGGLLLRDREYREERTFTSRLHTYFYIRLSSICGGERPPVCATA